jgi:hypothetical protein
MNGEHSEWRSPKSDADGSAIAGNFYFNALNDEFFRDVFGELSITQSSGYNTGLDVYADYPASPQRTRQLRPETMRRQYYQRIWIPMAIIQSQVQCHLCSEWGRRGRVIIGTVTCLMLIRLTGP